MIVVLKQNSDKERVERLMQHFKDMGLRINYSEGEDTHYSRPDGRHDPAR